MKATIEYKWEFVPSRVLRAYLIRRRSWWRREILATAPVFAYGRPYAEVVAKARADVLAGWAYHEQEASKPKGNVYPDIPSEEVTIDA